MQIEVEDLKKIKIEPDECLLVKLNKDFDLEQMDQIAKIISEALPKETHYLIYSEEAGEFQVIKQL